MPFRSFQGRILVFVLALVALTQVVTFVVVDVANTRDARQKIDQDLVTGSRIFVRLVEARTHQLAEAARLLSGDFGFKAAYSTLDAATIVSALENHQARIGADVMALVATDHTVMAATRPAMRDSPPAALPELVRTAEENGQAFGIVTIEDQPYRMVVVPLLAPIPVAWIGLGVVIDDKLATDLQGITQLHVSFVVPRPAGGWSMPGSTLKSSVRSALVRELPPALDAAAGNFGLRLDGLEYRSRTVPFPQEGKSGLVAILKTSVDEAFAPLYRLRVTLVAIVAGGLLISVIGAVVIARTVSRPVQTLLAGVRKIEQGDYTTPVEAARRDELGELAAAVNHMRVGIAQREEALRQSAEHLREAQKMEAIGRLAGGIAHDFNNLLTVMLGRLDLVLDRLDADHPIRADVELITTTAERAATLTQQLLALSRKQVLQTKVLNLNEVVSRFETMVRQLIGEDREMIMRLEPALAPVKADPSQIEQILFNLALNARDAMQPGGTLTIETANVGAGQMLPGVSSVAPPGPWVMLAVSDTGVGMSPEIQDRILEPFFTTKAVGKGTGLGLSIVYGIVKQHGGEIGVESTPGRGSTFTVYLPAIEATVMPDGTTSARVADLQGSETILLVEDEDEVRSLVASVLGRNGYRVLEAPDGAEAIHVAADHPAAIDLVVTDVVMPHMSGPELGERLKVARPGLRILYLSGYTADKLGEHKLQGHGVAFLQKPFTSSTLLWKLRQVLEGWPDEPE